MESGSVSTVVSSPQEPRAASGVVASVNSGSAPASDLPVGVSPASSSSSSVKNDAVSVELSASAKAIAPENVSSASPSAAEGIPRDDAVQLAKSYEKAINATQVKFSVGFEERGNNVINFQVIDKDTGQVLRQFPAESIKALEQKASAEPSSSGKLFDDSV